MTTVYFSPVGNGQTFFNTQGQILAGGKIFTYAAGTTTPLATYTDNTGTVQNANPIILNSAGQVSTGIWLSATTKFVIQDSSNNTIQTVDNIVGINNITVSIVNDWVQSGLTPTYISATQFSVVGDQSTIFTINRRVKCTVTAGIVYGSITGVGIVANVTTITVLLDTGTLDNGLSAVSYGFEDASHPSVQTNNNTFTGTTTLANSTVSGTMTVPTASVGTNSTQVASTAFVIANSPYRSFLSGLTLSTAGSSTTMSIAAGAAADSTNSVIMSLAAFTKTTASWAVGTGNGGLDTGATGGAASTWYYWYLIRRPDTGVVDVIFSLSNSAPTLPANYTQYRYIGAGLTDGSKNWTSFVQDGDMFQWSSITTDVNASSFGTAATLSTMNIPRKLGIIWYGTASLFTSTGQLVAMLVTDPATTAQTPTASLYDFLTTVTGSLAQSSLMQVRTNNTAQVRVQVTVSNPQTTVIMNTRGWIDRRGRDN